MPGIPELFFFYLFISLEW